MTETEHGGAVQKDREAYLSKSEHNLAQLIAHAKRKSGRSPFAIGREMIRFATSKFRVTFPEYVAYGLYDPDRYTTEERGEFIGAEMHGAVVGPILDPGWFQLTEDKWVSSVFLDADDIAQPETLAVIDRSDRAYQKVTRIDSAEGLRDFLTGDGVEFPLFCKFNNGRWSVGAATLETADATHLHLRGREPMSYDDFLADFVGDEAYLLQTFVRNHADLRAITPTTATVRLINMWEDDGLWVPYTLLKLPSAQNDADNFWRDGNLVCSVDPDSGEVLTAVSRDGPDLVNHETLPWGEQQIVGMKLPHWQAVRDLNAHVSALHRPVRYNSLDVALTDAGPVVIEVNNGSAFELPQIACGTGFMTPRVREFFRSCGSKIV